jgi:GNAT superfamily N-acetyltransferase
MRDFDQAHPELLAALKESRVAEGLDDNGISFQVQKGKNKFATTLSMGNNPVGVYQYNATTGRSIAEVYPEFKGKGLGKLLVLHAIYTATQLGLDFQEDESRTSEYDNVLDSLSSNGYIVDDDGYWYVTGEGEQYLKQSLKQDVAEGKIKLYTDPGYFGAEVDDAGFDSLPVVNISADRLVGFEPDSKMQQPKSKANVKKIVAGLKKGDKLPPLLVRKYKKGYQVLDGHHRFWAYKSLDAKSIPVQVVPDSDIEEKGRQGMSEGAMSDLDLDIQDEHWDGIVGYVIHGLKTGISAGRMELYLYKWAGQEMFDLDEELQGRGFGSLYELVDHIQEHGGKYVNPTFDLDGLFGDDEISENFKDGKNPQDKGDSKRHGINTRASVSSLRKTAKSGGRKGQLAHWLANMKAGRAKKS